MTLLVTIAAVFDVEPSRAMLVAFGIGMLALLIVGAASMAFAIYASREQHRRLSNSDPGVCVSCGYDLTGNVSGVCPECGTKLA
jgi:hypothetical protein